MAFALPDHWVWDFWTADDDDLVHLFYLHAPKALINPDLRHRNARIGHATSRDLVVWTDHGRIFDAGPKGSFDGTANWTGSVVRGPDGQWQMFYTGSRFLADDSVANVETVGRATSADLMTWTKQPGPVCVADPALYETLGTSDWPEEAWRDPWVFFNPGDGLWNMLITARACSGAGSDRGVMGHATSVDLSRWRVQPALSQPGAGFAHLEVFQWVEVEGRRHLVFCCDGPRLTGARAGQKGGIWTLPADELLSGLDTRAARLLVTEQLYAGRIVHDRAGRAHLLAFHNETRDGLFVGGICDPIPLITDQDGYLQLGDHHDA